MPYTSKAAALRSSSASSTEGSSSSSSLGGCIYRAVSNHSGRKTFGASPTMVQYTIFFSGGCDANTVRIILKRLGIVVIAFFQPACKFSDCSQIVTALDWFPVGYRLQQSRDGGLQQGSIEPMKRLHHLESRLGTY